MTQDKRGHDQVNLLCGIKCKKENFSDHMLTFECPHRCELSTVIFISIQAMPANR